MLLWHRHGTIDKPLKGWTLAAYRTILDFRYQSVEWTKISTAISIVSTAAIDSDSTKARLTWIDALLSLDMQRDALKSRTNIWGVIGRDVATHYDTPSNRKHAHGALHASILVTYNTRTVQQYHRKDSLRALVHTRDNQKVAMSFGLPRTTSYVSLHFASMHKQ